MAADNVWQQCAMALQPNMDDAREGAAAAGTPRGC